MTLKALVLTQKFYYGSKMSIKKEERITAIILGRRRDYSDNSRTILNYRCNSFLIGPMIQNTTIRLVEIFRVELSQE
jgi:hypothetical protein